MCQELPGPCTAEPTAELMKHSKTDL